MNGMYPMQAAAGGQVTAPTGSALGAARSAGGCLPVGAHTVRPSAVPAGTALIRAADALSLRTRVPIACQHLPPLMREAHQRGGTAGAAGRGDSVPRLRPGAYHAPTERDMLDEWDLSDAGRSGRSGDRPYGFCNRCSAQPQPLSHCVRTMCTPTQGNGFFDFPFDFAQGPLRVTTR